ncbi:MAG: tRNA pseudouridine(38-40) synthase TruA [Eubacteriales bacterium]|nr:tRNA pseudouridine(38-40) synthase TruA [Eubacteriales bacterium]
MTRILLTIAYDGTDFCGFQLQPGLRSVEGELNAAITKLTGEEITVIGASRTDSGVHALGNAAVFDTESSIPPERFANALNTVLPDDVRAVASREVAPDWHPRHQNCEKTYIYRVDCGYVPSPMDSRYAMHFPRNLDVTRMQEAAVRFLGEHDFTSFSNPKSQVLMAGGSPVRTITGIRVKQENTFGSNEGSDGRFGELVTIEVTGTGFLYNMVRIMAGTLLDVGTGRFTADDVTAMLEAKDRTKAGMTAEAKGLCLKEIHWQSIVAG